MKLKAIRKYFLFIPVLFLFSGCDKNPFEVDTSGIEINFEFQRFDEDLRQVDPDKVNSKIPFLQEEYDEFFELYNHRIINIGGPTNPAYEEYLKNFLTNYVVFQSMSAVEEKFEDLDWLKDELREAFKHYRYYFPDKNIPAVYTYFSGFNQSVVTAIDILGIGLDKYLGRDFEMYPRMGFNLYRIKNMVPAKIPSDCMRAWALSEFLMDEEDDQLLEHMLYHGKIMYFVKSMMPMEADTLIFGFTEDQLTFCRSNEHKMWEYIVENKFLFSTDFEIINRFIFEAPFTKDFSRESPGRAAVWLGFNIIHAYMRHEDTSLKELMNMNNYQEILEKSRYNP
jgi:hypothetical protein